MQPFEIVIPAISTIKYRGSKKHMKAIKKWYVCGYLSNPKKRITRKSSQSERDLVERCAKWRRWARHHLQAALFAEAWYNGQNTMEEGWHVHVQPYHENHSHPDGTNISKRVEDLLVSREKGLGTFFFRDDKKLSGSYGPPIIDKIHPRLVVTLAPPDSFSLLKKEVMPMK